MNVETKPALSDTAVISAILERVGQDLGSIIGRDLAFTQLTVGREHTRPAGKGLIHISFKLGLTREGGSRHFGSLLIPLPEAITMACFLLIIPVEVVAARRKELTLDSALKDAMLEIGNMVGGASNTALAGLGAAGLSLRSEGCQGVRPDVRPAFPYQEGSELMVGRANARFEPFPPFELILILPPIP